MIDPHTKPDGELYADYHRRRWGGDGWTAPMKRMGRAEGAPCANWKIWPNTHHASRLLLEAGRYGLGDAVIGRLYRACYEEGENVSRKEVVAAVAREAGVPNGDEYVLSGKGTDELAAELANAATSGGRRVRAAPTFELRAGASPALAFSGARETDEWLSLLHEAAEAAKPSAGA